MDADLSRSEYFLAAAAEAAPHPRTVTPPPESSSRAILAGGVPAPAEHLDQHEVVLVRVRVVALVRVERVGDEVLVVKPVRLQAVGIERPPLLAQVGLAHLDPFEGAVALVGARGPVRRAVRRRQDQVGGDEDSAGG